MRRIPRWARIVLIVIAVLLVIGLAAPYFLDANKYRDEIIAAIEEETGRKAQIGNIEARLIPNIGFVIEGVSIGNPPNFAAGNLLEVESIRGSLAWMPLLLRREFKLSSIELVNPKVVLLEDARGRNNYDFGKQEEQEQPTPAVEEGAAFRIADIDSIEVSGVDITVARVMGNRVVPSIHAWDISADLNNVALDRKRVKQWEAESNLKGAKVQLAALKDALEFTSGSFTLDEGKIDAKFGLALGKTVEADGTLKVDDVENAVAEFDLNTSVLDLSQLAGAGAETAPSPTPRQIGKSKLVAKGQLRAQKVRFAPLEGTNAKAEVRVFTDRMEVWPLSMQLYGGTVGATVRVDMRQQPERFSGSVELKQLNVEQLTQAVGSKQKVTGTGEVNLQLAGSLGENLINSLTGNGNLAVRDGQLPGLNLGSTMQSVAKVQKLLNFGADAAEKFGNSTPFKAVTADLTAKDGRVHSQRIHLDSPAAIVDMRGSLGLKDLSLDYNGNAVLVGGQNNEDSDSPIGAITGILGKVTKQNIERITIPFALRGTVADPKMLPGRGVPTFTTAPPAGEPKQQSQPEKKSILDLFRKPTKPPS